MDVRTAEQARKQSERGRPGGVLFIAVIQFVVSALIWIPFALTLRNDAFIDHQPIDPRANVVRTTRTFEYYEVVVGVPLCLSWFGVLTGTGLLRLRNWARRLTLCMATVPALACAIFLHVHHSESVDGTIMVVGDLSPNIAGALLAVLVPVGIWWWVFFMREDVRSRFD